MFYPKLIFIDIFIYVAEVFVLGNVNVIVTSNYIFTIAE